MNLGPLSQRIRLLALWIVAAALIGGVAAGVRASDDADDPNEGSLLTGDTAPTVPAGGGTVSTGQSGSSTTTGQTTAPSTTAAAGPAGKINAPVAGRYPLAVTGSVVYNNTQSFPAPPDGELYVEPTPEGDQRVTIPVLPGVVSSQLRYRDGGIDLVALDLILGPAKTFQPPTPVIYIAADPQAGQTWEWAMRSTDGATTGTSKTTVTGPATVDAAGQSLAVTMLTNVIQFDETSDLQGRVELTTWYAFERGLPVQYQSKVDVSYGGGLIVLVSDVTSTMTSLTPS